MERVEALSPELRNRTQSPTVYRLGTPASEMDIPVTQINLGPVCRNFSQSVPPNMSYRNSRSVDPSTSNRSTRRPSYPMPLSRVDENSALSAVDDASQPLSHISSPTQHSTDSVSHSGWMRKRKTKLLRHEWHEHHFTLKGSQLAMHKDEKATEILEAIDVDDYAIACSSLASGSKLNAAFKAINIKLGNKDRDRFDGSAFNFQLIPTAIEKGQRLRKRESLIGAVAGSSLSSATTKTHHFAVRSRDERIDWMRELMLAKALKQKSAGFEVNVNGNMI